MRANYPRRGVSVLAADLLKQRDMIPIGLHGTSLDRRHQLQPPAVDMRLDRLYQMPRLGHTGHLRKRFMETLVMAEKGHVVIAFGGMLLRGKDRRETLVIDTGFGKTAGNRLLDGAANEDRLAQSRLVMRCDDRADLRTDDDQPFAGQLLQGSAQRRS